ncbi:MAG: hypothetical protein MZU95_14550 [Desulfomicrobium escambiense]|nr:hypothetical protein [Desulfomicrobium escambiense]
MPWQAPGTSWPSAWPKMRTSRAPMRALFEKEGAIRSEVEAGTQERSRHVPGLL